MAQEEANGVSGKPDPSKTEAQEGRCPPGVDCDFIDRTAKDGCDFEMFWGD